MSDPEIFWVHEDTLAGHIDEYAAKRNFVIENIIVFFVEMSGDALVTMVGMSPEGSIYRASYYSYDEKIAFIRLPSDSRVSQRMKTVLSIMNDLGMDIGSLF